MGGAGAAARQIARGRARRIRVVRRRHHRPADHRRTTVEPPACGGARDAWLSRWTPAGTLQWVDAWGGPGDDLAKGVVDDGRAVSYVGPFTGTIAFGGTTLSAGVNADTLVAQRSVSGSVRWATSVSASAALDGTEVIAASDGGILFGSQSVPGIRFGSTTGPADRAQRGRRRHGLARPLPSRRHADVRSHHRGHGVRTRRRDRQSRVTGVRRRDAPRPGNTINGTPITVVGKDASVWALDLRG